MKKKVTTALAVSMAALLALFINTACTGLPGSNSARQNQSEPAPLQVNDKGAAENAAQPAATNTASAGENMSPNVVPGSKLSPLRSKEERMATSPSNNETTPGRHVVYLTFDDGPSNNTHRILEILAKYGVHATWFAKGNQDQIGYVKDIWEAGHQVAIHTFTHQYEQVYASEDSYWNDVEMAGNAIKEHIGFSPTLLRFPGGSTCGYATQIADRLIAGMGPRQMHYFDWNVSSGDGADHTADELFGYVKQGADGSNSCCVLMHDSIAKDTTVEALPRIIEYFINEGFEFDVLLADSFGYHF